MMTADDRHVTGGVDTHGDVHVAAVFDSATGRRLDVAEFGADTAGYVELHDWRCTFGVSTPSVSSRPAPGVLVSPDRCERLVSW